MFFRDILRISLTSLIDQRMRSFLTVLGIAVGIASVVLLTSIGEGVHRFMLSEFTQFGTNLIGINPGKTSTVGMSGAIINNIRPLSIADEEALRRLAGVIDTVSLVQGNAAV
jgi:putative ABC transport system permease protein